MERWPGMMAACGDKRAANLVAEARAVGAPVVTGVQPTRLSAEQTDVVLTALVDAGALAVTVGSDRLLEEVDAAARAMG